MRWFILSGAGKTVVQGFYFQDRQAIDKLCKLYLCDFYKEHKKYHR